MLFTNNNNFPLAAYPGAQPYIFISYAHADKEEVYKIISWLNENQYRVWYDEGIELGENFPDEIALKIRNCTYFVVFISNKSITRDFVIREIHYAKKCNRKMLPIYIEDTIMPPGLDFTIGTIQGIEMYKLDWDQFLSFLRKGLHDECNELYDKDSNYITEQNLDIMKQHSDDIEMKKIKHPPLKQGLVILQYILAFIPSLIAFFLSYILYQHPYHTDELLIYLPIQLIGVMFLNLICFSNIRKRQLDLIRIYKPFPFLITIEIMFAIVLDIFFVLDFYYFNSSDAFHLFGFGGILDFPLLSIATLCIFSGMLPSVLLMIFMWKKLKNNEAEYKNIYSKAQMLLLKVFTAFYIIYTVAITLGTANTYNTFGNTKEYFLQITPNITSNDYEIFYYDEYGLYEIGVNGKGKKLLTKDYCDDVLFDYQWLYYINRLDNNKIYKLYRPSNKIARLYDVSCDSIAIEENDEYIYYLNSEDKKIYKISKSGKDNIQIVDDCVDFFTVDKGWIYYSNRDDNNSIYKIAIDGSSKSRITDGACDKIQVSDEWVYFTRAVDASHDKLYKVKTDGSYETEMTNDFIDSFYVKGNWIYYLTILGGNYYYEIRIDGEEKRLINKE